MGFCAQRDSCKNQLLLRTAIISREGLFYKRVLDTIRFAIAVSSCMLQHPNQFTEYDTTFENTTY
jgi:hypothetical protein